MGWRLGWCDERECVCWFFYFNFFFRGVRGLIVFNVVIGLFYFLCNNFNVFVVISIVVFVFVSIVSYNLVIFNSVVMRKIFFSFSVIVMFWWILV